MFILINERKVKAYFNHLLRAHAVAFLRNNIPYFLLKTPKNKCRLGGCSVLNAPNLEKLGVKIYNCALLWTFLPFFSYTACMP